MKKVVIAQLSLQINKVDTFLKLAKIMVAESNAEKGCLTYKLLKEFATDNDFFIYEAYENEKAIEIHHSSVHYKDFVNSVIPLLAKEPSIETF
ncbi:putative quinol monooxygenase [Aquimarina longa]|uniref:putative quinol monooxygenase n=1 Tax=Aquimarina longa TaxID=1080221 RepID=UPI000783A208|nr:putative quinol monooxygenase [Aquimarina longa]